MKSLLKMMALFLGGIFLAASPALAGTITKANTFSSGATASAAQVNANFDQLFTEINSKESRITTLESSAPVTAAFFTDEVTATAGTLTTFMDTSQQYNFYRTNGAGGADGDGFQTHIFLKAGNYTLYALGIDFTNRGKIDWYVDGSLAISGQDWYAAGLAYNTIHSSALTVNTSGDHTLSAVVHGHNGASGGFAYTITKIWIK
ncbi:MAG: hypothetical protein ACXWQO_18635 [Bdellovibrionota bacterium]